MGSSYTKLAVAIGINAVVMFFLTYVMIASIEHFHANINRTYMALIMAAPMVLVMLTVMRSMFENRRLNTFLYVAVGALFLLLFFLIRTQTPVGNQQFLRSMISHHSEAVLVCRQANLTDPEIVDLCDEIIETQLEEIAQMEAILDRIR